jgi:transcriptional antiterminator RfaH
MFMKQWFVVNTKARNENRAATNLLSGGIEALNPKLRLRKFRDGGFIYVIEPMFPNYIFAKFDPIDEFHLIKYTRGVRTIVNFSGKIIPLHDEVIAFIKTKLENGVASVQKKGFRKGDKITIKDGPFRGLNGIFEEEIGGEERVAILLEGVNYYARMEIDRDLIAGA